MDRVRRVVASAGIAVGGLAPPVFAGDESGWQFEFTPYLIMAGLDGTVGAQGNTVDVDASFSDILDNLEAGFMGIFTAQKGPWTFGLDGIYMKLEADGAFDVSPGPGPKVIGVDLASESEMTIWQGSVGYRVLDDETEVDLVGALRYVDLDQEIRVSLSEPPPFLGGTRIASGSESWTDVVIGARALHPVSQNVSLVGYFDIGAGGSDLTYQVAGGVNWELNDTFVAKAGYRYMYWDYEDDGTVWDISASGPYVGLGIRF